MPNIQVDKDRYAFLYYAVYYKNQMKLRSVLPQLLNHEQIISVDETLFNSLKYEFFKGEKPFPIVAKKAYQDLCRTLRLHGESGIKYRDEISYNLKKIISKMLEIPTTSQVDYDNWHKAVCTYITDYYHDKPVEFTFGQAQKWLNMTMKYIFMHGEMDISAIFPFLHIPLDNYVFAAAENKLFLKRPDDPWSRIKDYSKYYDFQKKLRKSINGVPLRWEFENWLETAIAEAFKKQAI